MAAILIGGRGRRIQLLIGDHARTIPVKRGPNWPCGFKEEDFLMIFFAEFSIFSHGGHLGWRAGSSDTTFKGTTQGPSLPSLVQIGPVVSEKKIFNDFFAEFSIFSHGGHLVWQDFRLVVGYNPERGPPKDHPSQVWSKLAKWFQRKKILMIFLAKFSIFSHMSHLVGGRGCRIQLLKGTTQGPSLPSLVQIGPVVSEKKIFNDIFAEFSIFSHGGHLSWWAGSWDTTL